jgi:hypothetical protein
MWSDGLPLLPATEERVSWILTGTDLSPDAIVGEGKVLPRAGIASVETLAVALAMAGGRPEYLPVFIAAVEAYITPAMKHQDGQATTDSPYPAVLVNGPIADQIRLNSGHHYLGPDPQHPAGGCIGRAFRILLQNAGGAIPGIGTMAVTGSGRYTNIVFAEDEAGLPEGWDPLSVQRGFSKGSNVVTVMQAGPVIAFGGGSATEKAKAQSCPIAIASCLKPRNDLWSLTSATISPYLGSKSPFRDERGEVEGMAVIGRITAAGMASFGWRKEDLRDAIWEYSKIPWPVIESNFTPDEIKAYIDDPNCPGLWVEGKPWPIMRNPDCVLVVVAGGEPSHKACFILQNGAGGEVAISKEIKHLPAKAKWDELLEQAEEDLGPNPGFT